jgi:hypothetical protein
VTTAQHPYSFPGGIRLAASIASCESPVADQIERLADRVDFDVSPGLIDVDHIVVAEVNSDVMGVIAMGVVASEESKVSRLRRAYLGHHGQFGIGVAPPRTSLP